LSCGGYSGLYFSAAFPFFSNVDEDLHFDLITQYSHGHLPRTFDPLKEETHGCSAESILFCLFW